MKGIKTEVKTEWKNYAHGNTRHYDFRKYYEGKESDLTISGFKAGDKICVSCTIRWRLASEGQTDGYHIQSHAIDIYYLGDHFVGKPNEDNIAHYKDSFITKSDKDIILYSPKWKGQLGGKVDENSYLIIENFMASKDNFLPYIDSDELKATGGAINKARIVAFVLSEERRAA